MFAASRPHQCRNDCSSDQGSLLFVRDRAGNGFLLLVSLALNAWIEAGRISVPRTATFLISFLVIAVLFAALYKIVPDVRLNWSDVALGAMITSLLFMLGKELMGLYFAHTASYRHTVLPARQWWCSCGFTIRHSFSFGALSSARCTRRPWNPRAAGIVDGAPRLDRWWAHDCSIRSEGHQYGERDER